MGEIRTLKSGEQSSRIDADASGHSNTSERSVRESETHLEFLSWINDCRRLEEYDVRYDPEQKIIWTHMNPKSRPSVTRNLAEEVRWFQGKLAEYFRALDPGDCPSVRYMVCASSIPGVFSMGGDLCLFETLVRERDRDGLLDYATACIDVVYANYVNLDVPLITISLVQGDALGGGFEAAVSSNVVVAERSAKFGLPECLFNAFPGMGAYSLISRRIGPIQAERMILNGGTYSAEQLFEMGLVDCLAEDGEGEQALRTYLHKLDRQHTMRRAVFQARRRVSPLSYEELYDITVLWVDTVLEMSDMDLRKMSRLAAAQDRRLAR